MTDAIEVADLRKTFKGGVRAVDGVTFTTARGAVFGLLGPNGAGKTTIVRILTTVLAADGGVARVLGHDCDREAQTVRTVIGLAGQYAAVDENLTGAENLRMVGRLNHLPRAVVDDRTPRLLDQFGLSDAADRPLKTYSGGMRRKLDLAAALVSDPKVLFLDEPTTGLDPQSRADMWARIEELVDRGTTVLLTTQYLEEADRLCSSLVVIDHGRVIAAGTPASLKADLGATVLDIGLAGGDAARTAATVLAGVGGKAPVVVGDTVELNVDDGPRVVTEALRLLEDHGLAPITINLRQPSLDDVFLALTGKRTAPDQETDAATTTPRGRPRRSA